ncbi:hypothetical protein D3C74_324850 [compost metagenome]
MAARSWEEKIKDTIPDTMPDARLEAYCSTQLPEAEFKLISSKGEMILGVFEKDRYPDGVDRMYVIKCWSGQCWEFWDMLPRF